MAMYATKIIACLQGHNYVIILHEPIGHCTNKSTMGIDRAR